MSNFKYNVNPSKRVGMDGVFFGLAGLLLHFQEPITQREGEIVTKKIIYKKKNVCSVEEKKYQSPEKCTQTRFAWFVTICKSDSLSLLHISILQLVFLVLVFPNKIPFYAFNLLFPSTF